MACWSVRGSVTISSRGSRYLGVIWFVNVPGIQRPAKGLALVYWPHFHRFRAQFLLEALNFSTAREP